MGKHTLKFTETQYIGRNFLNSGGWTVSRFTWVGAWPVICGGDFEGCWCSMEAINTTASVSKVCFLKQGKYLKFFPQCVFFSYSFSESFYSNWNI